MLTYLELGHDLFSSSCQYAFHCSMILLGELPPLLGRLQTPAELCGVHERFGSVMLALPPLLGRLQTPTELCGVHERFGSVMLALPPLLGRLQTPAELCGVHERFGSVM